MTAQNNKKFTKMPLNPPNIAVLVIIINSHPFLCNTNKHNVFPHNTTTPPLTCLSRKMEYISSEVHLNSTSSWCSFLGKGALGSLLPYTTCSLKPFLSLSDIICRIAITIICIIRIFSILVELFQLPLTLSFLEQ